MNHDTREQGRYLLKGYGEGDPAALLERLHHLLGDLAPRPANGRARHDLAPRWPRRLAGLHPLYHIQQQFRRQVRPPPLMLMLMLRPLLALPLRLLLLRPQARPRMPRPRAAVAGAPVGAAAAASRHAPDTVPHLLQLPHNALERHCSLRASSFRLRRKELLMLYGKIRHNYSESKPQSSSLAGGQLIK